MEPELIKSAAKGFTVFVEGNVGSGKSTLLEHFQKYEDILVLEEPVEKWTDFYGLNLLDLKFSDPERFQFPFQTFATLTRLKQHLQPCEKPIKLMERSLLTARRCFVNNLHDSGLLHPGMFHVLNEWYDFINEAHPVQCDAIIYLRTSPQVALARVQARARKEETTISKVYLKQLHERHEELFFQSNLVKETSIIIVEADRDLEEMETEYNRCYQEIKQLLSSQIENCAIIQI